MEKIDFSGGEPFLHDRGEYLGKLVKFCKTELQLPSVSIVSNGSLIRERWFQNYGVLHGMALSLLLLLLLVLVFPSILGLQPDLLRNWKGGKTNLANSNRFSSCAQHYGSFTSLGLSVNKFGKLDNRPYY